ncbi:MAG TPA: TadE/TadG family type IV pilus assembly protein [Candidatus Limnocylindrales bacterium]
MDDQSNSKHRSSRRWRSRDDRGQSLVEFTLVLPIFILLLAGMIDFGLGLFADLTIINAAREGARLGVIANPMSTTAIESRVRAMTTGLDGTALTVTTTCLRPTSPTTFAACASPQWVAGDSVRVQVDYDYSMIWPLTFGTHIPMSSTVLMRIE